MHLSRGELAEKSGCNGETIRFYERIGLLPEPKRTPAGHRRYGEADLQRLTFILRGRQLGFTIEELRDLLALVDGGDFTCRDVREIAATHQAAIRRKIADLRKLERTLQTMIAACDDGQHPGCPVIDALGATV